MKNARVRPHARTHALTHTDPPPHVQRDRDQRLRRQLPSSSWPHAAARSRPDRKRGIPPRQKRPISCGPRSITFGVASAACRFKWRVWRARTHRRVRRVTLQRDVPYARARREIRAIPSPERQAGVPRTPSSGLSRGYVWFL